MQFTLALALACSPCATGSAHNPLSVRQVVENARALDGQKIVVTGWIEYCHRRSCPLFGSPEDVGAEWPYVLAIGRSSWFDAFARHNAPVRVTLLAKVNDLCITDPATRIIAACADRSNTLEPIRLAR